MSRLDRHVAAVQNKMTLGRMLDGLAWASLAFAAVVFLAILMEKLFRLSLPRQEVWFWIGMIATLAAALGYALIRRPSRHEAAVAIDQKLGLKEKFSTALYIRPSGDPFARAAVRDAEATADNVSLYKRFPLHFPRPAYATLIVAMVAFLTAQFVKPLDLFGHEERQRKQAIEAQRAEEARKSVEKALATVNTVPKAVADEEAVKLARKDLEELLKQPIKDPAKAHRSALKALQDVNEAIKQQIKDNQRFATAQNDAKMMRSLTPPADEKGPVAEAHRAIAKGDFTKGVDELEKAVKNFDKMSEEEKQKAADQMKQMAQQLQQMANDPAKQQQIQQQLQQMGATQQQAQQMAQQMQQAAQGDKQAQQQLQQMAQQMMQQMNNGQGPTQQQQQQIQQMMQQMQAQANTQQQAQQMAQAAQQMAQAMQQQAQAGQQQQGQQGGQQQQGQQGGQQQMAQGAQQMQQQLQQMQAMQQDAQQIAAAQQAAQQAADQAAGACNNPGGQAGNNQNNQGQGAQGEWAQGNPDGKQGNGMGGPGQGAGGRAKSAFAPFGVKQEISPSQDRDEGRVLASTFVKANALRGESKEQLKDVAAAVQNEATDEVDQERISRQAQKVVRDYFGSMEEDAQ